MNASVFLHTAAMLYIEILWSPLCFQSFYLLLFTAGGCGDVILTFHPFSAEICCASKPLVCDSPRPPLTVVTVDPSGAKPFFCVFVSKETAVRWLQYCWCRRSQLRLGQDPVGPVAPEPALGLIWS